MSIQVIKSKCRTFGELYKNENLYIIDVGFNDFRYLAPSKTYRILANYTFHFITSGRGRLFVREKCFYLSAGDVFLLPPGVPIMYYPEEQEPWRYYWFNISGNAAEDMAKDMGFNENTPTKHISLNSDFAAEFESVFILGQKQKECYYNALSVLYGLASKLCSSVETETYIKTSNLSERVKEIIALNYKNPDFTIELLADIMHVSHSYICKLFKEETGTTIVKYLVNYRLDKSVELIKEQKMLIKDLCFSVGFNDELHFMKEFKRKYGVTVKQYGGK